MELNDILSYNPVSSDKRLQAQARANDDDDTFKAPLSKRPRQINDRDISATPGRTPRKVMAPGTPFHRAVAPQLDMVPSSLTPLSNSQRSNAAQMAYDGSVEFVDNTDPSDPASSSTSKNSAMSREENDLRLNQMLEKLEAEMAKQDPKDQIPVIESEAEAKRLLIKIKKSFLKNQQMRVKSDDPNKFLDSEIELASVLEHFRGFATAPQYYHLINEDFFGTVVIPCLSHENVDICGAIVLCLMEFCETAEEKTMDEQERAIEYADGLAKILLREEYSFFDLLINLLNRLDEKNEDEATSLHNCFGIVENLLEFVENVWILDVIYNSKLISWLMRRIKTDPRLEPHPGNKLFCLEIISTLTSSESHSAKFIESVGKENGIDALLKQCSFYRKKDPTDEIESECIQNVYNILTACVQSSNRNRAKFLEIEGLQLMIITIREKCQARHLALKVLANLVALKGDAVTKKVIRTLISKCLALKSLCPLLLRPPKQLKSKVKKEKNLADITLTKQENTENIVAIFAAMFQELEPNCEEHVRLIQKFCENRCDKTSRVIELHQLYLAQVNKFDQILIASQKKLDEESYLSRLENGLYVLQMVDYIIVDLAINGNEIVKEHLKKTMKMKNVKSQTIATIVKEYATELVPLPETLEGESASSNSNSNSTTTSTSKASVPVESITKEKQQRFSNAETIANKAIKYSNMFAGSLGTSSGK